MTCSALRLLAVTTNLLPAIAPAQVDYARAERMLAWNTGPS